MLFVLIIQRVEHRHRDLGFSLIARRRLLLPEAICPTEVQKVVAADAGVRWGKAANGGKGRKGRRDRIGGRAIVMVADLAAQSILPLSPEANIPFESGRATLSLSSERLADFLIGEIGEVAQPAGGQILGS